MHPIALELSSRGISVAALFLLTLESDGAGLHAVPFELKARAALNSFERLAHLIGAIDVG